MYNAIFSSSGVTGELGYNYLLQPFPNLNFQYNRNGLPLCRYKLIIGCEIKCSRQSKDKSQIICVNDKVSVTSLTESIIKRCSLLPSTTSSKFIHELGKTTGGLSFVNKGVYR